MEWLNAMNRAVEYIEDNITERLDIEKVAKIALSSAFHFQRMYHMITGITIGEYVRRRRLTLAAQDILSGEKIIDVAYKYGYETPEAFAKAFRKMHGISPSAAREPGICLNAYPKLNFHISIKGDKNMNYRIIEKESFTVVGRQAKISSEDGMNLNLVPEFWQKCQTDGSYEWMCANAGELGILGVSTDLISYCEGSFNYTLAIEKVKEPLPKGYTTIDIPSAKWAVFESVGPVLEAAHDVVRRIFTEWLPSTGYQIECAPQIEVYPVGDMSAKDYRCEIWIPIKK